MVGIYNGENLSFVENLAEADSLQWPETFLMHFRESQEASTQLRTQYAHSRATRQRQQYPIVNVNVLVQLATHCITAPSYTRVIAGLELLTGRRPYELAITARFAVADERYVWFQGQAKTRGSVPSDHRYSIPVLAPASDICTALDHLRSVRSFAGYTSEQFDDTAGKTLRETRRRVFGALLPEGALQVKEALRKVYGCVAYDWFAQPAISYNAYLADILGHSYDDVTTTNSYQDFYLAMPQERDSS